MIAEAAVLLTTFTATASPMRLRTSGRRAAGTKQAIECPQQSMSWSGMASTDRLADELQSGKPLTRSAECERFAQETLAQLREPADLDEWAAGLVRSVVDLHD